jgi:hypothetical protein
MAAEKLHVSTGAARGEILLVKCPLKPQIRTISTVPTGYVSRRRFGVAWGRFMWGNWSRQPHAPGETDRDKKAVFILMPVYGKQFTEDMLGIGLGIKKLKGLGFHLTP